MALYVGGVRDGEVATAGPSQSRDAAERDGVVPAVAELSVDDRVAVQVEVSASEGTWVLAELSDQVSKDAQALGCVVGDPDGEYLVDFVCAGEYGEILLRDSEGEIVRAFPMPGAPPSWIHLTSSAVLAGRIGDGGLPVSTLVRIDRETYEIVVVVFPNNLEEFRPEQWPATWIIANDDQTEAYQEVVGFSPEMAGTATASWIGPIVIDLDEIVELIDGLSTQ